MLLHTRARLTLKVKSISTSCNLLHLPSEHSGVGVGGRWVSESQEKVEVLNGPWRTGALHLFSRNYDARLTARLRQGAARSGGV